MRRVAGIAQDVTLAGRHAAGKLDPRDEFHFCRRMALQLLCPSYSVVVREGKNSDTGGLPSLSELEGEGPFRRTPWNACEDQFCLA